MCRAYLLDCIPNVDRKLAFPNCEREAVEPLSCQEVRGEHRREVGEGKRGRGIVFIVFIVASRGEWECEGRDEGEGMDGRVHEHPWAQTLSSAYNRVLVHTQISVGGPNPCPNLLLMAFSTIGPKGTRRSP